MAKLLTRYTPDRAWDEMFAAAGQPRPHYEALSRALDELSHEQLDARCAARDRAFHD